MGERGGLVRAGQCFRIFLFRTPPFAFDLGGGVFGGLGIFIGISVGL